MLNSLVSPETTPREASEPRGPEAASVDTFGFLLVPDFTLIAFASAIDTLRLANICSGRTLYAWKLYSPDGRPVMASTGVAVAVHGSFAEAGAMTAAVVCGGADIQRFDPRELCARLRTLASYGAAIGAVCTGTHVLAKAGLLAGRRCTIHWENHDGFHEAFPDIEVTQELFEIDRNRFTCAGGTAAIDMMLSIIAKQKGADIAAQVTDQLIHHRIRDAHERQRMELRARLGVAHPKLLAVVQEMENTLETPRSCAELAAAVDLSTRQLERLFRKYIGEAPTRYYLGLRLNRARFLLRQTSMPILTIGLACGFVSASHFSKCFSETFGRTPSQERRVQT